MDDAMSSLSQASKHTANSVQVIYWLYFNELSNLAVILIHLSQWVLLISGYWSLNASKTRQHSTLLKDQCLVRQTLPAYPEGPSR